MNSKRLLNLNIRINTPQSRQQRRSHLVTGRNQTETLARDQRFIQQHAGSQINQSNVKGLSLAWVNRLSTGPAGAIMAGEGPEPAPGAAGSIRC